MARPIMRTRTINQKSLRWNIEETATWPTGQLPTISIGQEKFGSGYAAGHRFIFLAKLPVKTTQDIVNEALDTVQAEEVGFRTAMLEIISQASRK